MKENNCIDGTHYYTLVEANLRSEALVKEGNNDIALSWYPASENGKKVADAKTFAALNTKEVTRSYEQPDGSTVTVKYYADANGNIASAPYYDKDGNGIPANALDKYFTASVGADGAVSPSARNDAGKL